MTDQPSAPNNPAVRAQAPAGVRGAVDLSSMGAQPAGPATAGGARPPTGSPATPDAVPGRRGLVLEGNDANFNEVVNGSLSLPLLMVVWSDRLPESRAYLDTAIAVARSLEGRVQVVSVDVDANPALHRALQVESVPVSFGIVQGQPVPLFAGVQTAENLRQVLDQLLQMSVQNGVAGRIDISGDAADPADDELEPELPPLHQAAYDAIEQGDLAAAATAYQQAIAQNPSDLDAKVGLAQVGLMQRTDGVDLQQARADAAEKPQDVAVQSLVADFDVLGGHVEDAFLRLIDLVRSTVGDDREAARAHLLELFEVVGGQDERVRKARTSLMSALF